MTFGWDEEKAAVNFERHGVGFEEARFVFEDKDAIEEFDIDRSTDEDRFRRIGLSDRRLLLVVYTVRAGGSIRIIHPRKAGKSMKRLYEQNKQDKS